MPRRPLSLFWPRGFGRSSGPLAYVLGWLAVFCVTFAFATLLSPTFTKAYALTGSSCLIYALLAGPAQTLRGVLASFVAALLAGLACGFVAKAAATARPQSDEFSIAAARVREMLRPTFSLRSLFLLTAIVGAVVAFWPTVLFVISGGAYIHPAPTPLQNALDWAEEDSLAHKWQETQPGEYAMQITGGQLSAETANALVEATKFTEVTTSVPLSGAAEHALSEGFTRTEQGAVVVWRRKPRPPGFWKRWGS
jgi:hypothetical protein